MMPEVKIRVGSKLRSQIGGKPEIVIRGSNVGVAIRSICARYPDLSPGLLDSGGRLVTTANIYLNSRDIRYLEGEETRLKAGDEVLILPAATGG